MSERKVLNKYFPPDFDPSKIPRRKLPKDQQHKVRLMTPFSMQCTICGEYVYKGKKFNARKERVDGENYLGIQVFRFYIRCPRCSGEITFKTDPKNADYVAEHGAQRNFEPWRDDGDATEAEKALRAQAEENNPMAALENRTLDSKREMDILDALDEIRMRNAKNERVDSDGVLQNIILTGIEERELAKRLQEEEDDRLAQSIFHSADGQSVKRILDEDEEEAERARAAKRQALLNEGQDDFIHAGQKKTSAATAFGIVVKKKPATSIGVVVKKPEPTKLSQGPSVSASAGPSALAILGGAYSDSEDEEDS